MTTMEQHMPKKFLGGRPCLDFVNMMQDWETDYAQLVSWSQQSGLLTQVEGQALVEKAIHAPDEAARVLACARLLRHAIYQIFSAVAHKRSPEVEDLTTLNGMLSEAFSRLLVVSSPTGFIWEWDNRSEALDRILWPVVRSAAELLTDAELDRVRECAGDDCDQLFLDQTRNRSRRWCEMQHCGMLVKSRRYYARKKQISNVVSEV
jgi:predicted RNA-binding Zn ribbon-like protein